MAVPISNVTRRVVFAASGVGPYAFTFEILAQTDIAVYEDDTLLTLTTDYTVTINANGTGSITLVSSPTGSQISIIGARAIERTSDFVTGGDFFANTLNTELDSLTIFAQQNSEAVARALSAPETDPTTVNMTLPRASVRANKTLAFDSNGDPVIGEVIGDNRGNWAAGTAYNKRDIVKDTSNNNVYLANTAHTSSGSLPISSNADAAKWDLLVDAASAAAAQAAAEAAQAAAENAQTAAENAQSYAEEWANKAEDSLVSTDAGGDGSTEYSAKHWAAKAEDQKDLAVSAKNAAVSAQGAAESARDATLAAYDSFDDRYLGAKASDPALDNDGDALAAGMLYYNTTVPEMRLYTGSAWVAAYVSGASYLASASNLSDLADAATARQNLGVEIGVDVQAYDADTAKYDDVTANFTGTLQNGGHTVLTTASDYLDSADIGVSVQAYDADTAKTDTAQTFTASQRGTVTSDNDLSFDLSATNNFSCTPTAGGTLTFTNHTAGQSGFILLDNSSGYSITAAATTKINAADLTTISTAGVYVLSYFDNGTNAYIMVSRSFA